MSLQDDALDFLHSQEVQQSDFTRAVAESLDDIVPIVAANEAYKRNNVLHRLIMPEQVLNFKIEWEDDEQNCRVNQAWRVQHSNLLGPFKGGTRFVPSLDVSVLKFLAYEQSFKNALSGLSIGAGKGGADFNPKVHSVSERRRFSKAYMRALACHIGPATDVPAGDIGVSSKELGWMYGEYLKQTREFHGSLSGKPLALGGSEMRIEATGFGVIYFLKEVLQHHDMALKGKRIAISGAGNVALHAAKKAIDEGACVLTLSNSRGVYVNEEGLSNKELQFLLSEGQDFNNALEALSHESQGDYLGNASPWDYDADIAIPCATQNEIDEAAAVKIAKRASIMIEGANMPCTSDAQSHLKHSDIIYVPGKAANAGGVVMSAFEMQQNAGFNYDSKQRLDEALKGQMQAIHERCVNESQRLQQDTLDYARSATVAGFRRLADALVAASF